MFNNLKTIREQNKKIKKMNVDLAESRTVEQARLIKAISDELNINQYNSIDNLIKKLKSMLNVPGKHF